MFVRILLVLSGLILINPVAVFAQAGGDSITRLTDLKNGYLINTTEELKQKITASCDETVNQVTKIQQSNTLSTKKRLLLYKDVSKDLKAIEFRTLRQGVDTSELDLLLGNNQQLIKTINDLADNQNVLVGDLKSIDCKTSPDLFLAGLYKFRENQKALKESTNTIHQDLKESNDDTFKPLAERLRL